MGPPFQSLVFLKEKFKCVMLKSTCICKHKKKEIKKLPSVQKVISSETVNSERGTFICAHAWIFVKLCILTNYYIRTMKMYLSNYIVKNKAYEATLTHSTFEVVPVSKFPCLKSMVLFISVICHLD